MVGLIDCNNFFVSCERIFRPDLVSKPVVVMSNNDGCAVAMSNEAKSLGIKRGVPVYQIKRLIKEHGVVTLSGSHRMYGDISSRVMATISSIVPDIEIYSIDEAFLDLSPWHESSELEEIGRKVVSKVRRDVGIPSSLGIAPTKTLAKIASHFAKKYPGYRGVCIIDNDEKRRKALQLTEITDVWGIGRRLGRKMNEVGIRTALQFAELPIDKVHLLVNVNGERSWRELNGEACIEIDMNESSRKQICTTRSFRTSYTSIEPLREAITWCSGNVARRLRAQKGCAKNMTVFIQTNSYRPDQLQHYGNQTVTFEEATDDTLAITSAAIRMLYGMFREGYAYKRAGVMITDIVSRSAVQQSLFADAASREKRSRLMKALDTINTSVGNESRLHVGSAQPFCSNSGPRTSLPPLSIFISPYISVRSVSKYEEAPTDDDR